MSEQERTWQEQMPKATIPSTWCIDNSTIEVQYGVQTREEVFHPGGITLRIFHHPTDRPKVKEQLSIQLKSGDALAVVMAMLAFISLDEEGIARLGAAVLREDTENKMKEFDRLLSIMQKLHEWGRP